MCYENFQDVNVNLLHNSDTDDKLTVETGEIDKIYECFVLFSV